LLTPTQGGKLVPLVDSPDELGTAVDRPVQGPSAAIRDMSVPPIVSSNALVQHSGETGSGDDWRKSLKICKKIITIATVKRSDKRYEQLRAA
jgi:hypothetical protein